MSINSYLQQNLTPMRKFKTSILLLFIALGANAQFGFYSKKSEIESFKETKLVVVLFFDSAYNAAIEQAVTRHWKVNAFEFAFDNDLLKYKKENVAYLVFSKSKGSKNKAKLCSAEEDFNGLIIMNKFKRRAPKEEVRALAFCSNQIDTPDWDPELQRAVQMLNNYYDYALKAGKDSELSASKMMNNYPSDKNQLLDKKLLVEDKYLDIKGKKDANTLFDGEVEEVDKDVIYKAVLEQDNALLYYLWVKDEKYCNKLVISAQNSELMYYNVSSPDKCKLSNSDLEEVNKIKKKAIKENSK